MNNPLNKTSRVDMDEVAYLESRGEFSIYTELAFERHLKRLYDQITNHRGDIFKQEPMWF